MIRPVRPKMVDMWSSGGRQEGRVTVGQIPMQTRTQRPGASVHLDFAHRLADLSGQAILPFFRRTMAVANKAGAAGYDPVTAADRSAERKIRKAIAAQFPGHGILGEEFGTRPGTEPYQWVIDPIDGTRAFITGSPLWGTLIGLLEEGRPCLGVMNQPFTGERFWSHGTSARARAPNGTIRRLKTRRRASLSETILTTTHPDLFASAIERSAFQRLKAKARMTRYGGDCYGYCLLAAGCIDLIVESGLKPYDVVALIPIIEGAGGIITTWTGEEATSGGRIIAAGDARVHAEALALLRSSSA
jgi:histidinol phosphatase-like enzyme (inositol monophosphatase family)